MANGAARPRLWILEFAAAAMIAACGSESRPASSLPAAPSAPPAPPVTSIVVAGTSPNIGSSAQLTATATLSNGATQSVTSVSTWQSSNNGVLTVTSSGTVTAVAEGDADVTASYSGASGSLHLRVAAPRYGLSGVITDDPSRRPIAGARVEVLNGFNAGKAVVTGVAGDYVFDALLPDTFRMRASADDYLWGEQNVTVPSNPHADFGLRRVPASCTVSVSPTFVGVSSGGIVNPRHFDISTSSNCAWTVTSNRLLLKLRVDDAPSYSVSGSGVASVLLNYGISLCAWTDTMKVTWAGGEIAVAVQQFFPIC